MKIFRELLPVLACITVLAIVLAGVSCKNKMLTQEMAFKEIQSLPEVQEYTAQLREKGSRPYVRQELSDKQSSLMQFSVGESHPTHVIIWKRFSVDTSNGNISIFDIESGEYLPIEEWRTENKR